MEPGRPKLCRAADGRALGGVAAGIGRHLGIPPIVVRIGFVALLAVNGLGALLYAAFWAVLPVEHPTRPTRRETGQLVAMAAVAVGLVIMVSLVGWGGSTAALGWLVAVIAVGAGVIWHQADPERRRRWSEANAPQRLRFLAGPLSGNDWRAVTVRMGAGALLVAAGIIGIVAMTSTLAGGSWHIVLISLLFTLLAVAGISVVVGPLLWRQVTQLRTEREVRVRETERAEIAAMVHDQVLHTLALIQRNSEDPREVSRLARGQERTLRNWLYKPAASPNEKLGAALEEVSAEVEDAFALSVDTVVVGDCDVDEDIAALVAAAREAMVNAGKHAKVRAVSLYAEVEPPQVSVFVRDRGVGFDPDRVGDDRHGVQGSIIGRMERHGGTVEVRSTPGEGTEIRLFMPRSEGKRSESKGERR